MGVGELGWEGMCEVGKLINEQRCVWEKNGVAGVGQCGGTRYGR